MANNMSMLSKRMNLKLGSPAGPTRSGNLRGNKTWWYSGFGVKRELAREQNQLVNLAKKTVMKSRSGGLELAEAVGEQFGPVAQLL